MSSALRVRDDAIATGSRRVQPTLRRNRCTSRDQLPLGIVGINAVRTYAKTQ
jgi:hypothetical protein